MTGADENVHARGSSFFFYYFEELRDRCLRRGALATRIACEATYRSAGTDGGGDTGFDKFAIGSNNPVGFVSVTSPTRPLWQASRAVGAGTTDGSERNFKIQASPYSFDHLRYPKSGPKADFVGLTKSAKLSPPDAIATRRRGLGFVRRFTDQTSNLVGIRGNPKLHTEPSIVFSIGSVLIAALLFGRLAGLMHIPRVTAYLLVGLLLASSTVSLLPHEWVEGTSFIKHIELIGHHLHDLHPVADLAMALVLFNMGCHFTLVHFRRIMDRAFHLSRGELVCTFMCVVGGLILLRIDLYSACLYGVLALATAPATTILVLKEAESEGPITEYTTALVAMNNLVAVLAFEFLFFLINWNDGKLQQHWSAELLGLVQTLSLSLAVGAMGGLAISYLCGRFESKRWLVVLLAVITLVLGVCLSFDWPYLLTFLAMGITVANSSDVANDITQELARVTSLLCVMFFVIHGADMNIGALIAAGMVGVVYIACRTFGKFIGIYITGHHEGPAVRRWLGLALVSQAGAALTLAGQASARNPDRCLAIQQVILGSVVFFEIVGPILVRQAVIRSGETPLDKAILHTSTTVWEGLQEVGNRLLVAIGRDPWATTPVETLTVGQLMRRNVKGIKANATFDEIAHWIEHSHDNTFPVVDETDELLGVILYVDIRDNVFDPGLSALVNATDLAVRPQLTLCPDEPLSVAIDHFRKGSQDAIPIIERDSNRYLGLARRKDLIRFFRRTQDSASTDESKTG